jgi:hypothetical protein
MDKIVSLREILDNHGKVFVDTNAFSDNFIPKFQDPNFFRDNFDKLSEYRDRLRERVGLLLGSDNYCILPSVQKEILSNANRFGMMINIVYGCSTLGKRNKQKKKRRISDRDRKIESLFNEISGMFLQLSKESPVYNGEKSPLLVRVKGSSVADHDLVGSAVGYALSTGNSSAIVSHDKHISTLMSKIPESKVKEHLDVLRELVFRFRPKYKISNRFTRYTIDESPNFSV